MDRLKFQKNGDTYISKPFDFEAMCRVNDEHSSSEKNGILRICRPAVEYLFDGTEVDISDIPPSETARMCREVWDMYAEAMAPSKKDAAASTPAAEN